MRLHKPGNIGTPGIALAVLLGAPGLCAETVDRVAAIVGNQVIALSEIDLELRIEAMLSNSDFSGVGSRQDEVLQRLIDRRLVLQELSLTPFLLVQQEEIDKQVEQLSSERYLDTMDFATALKYYRLTEEDFRAYLTENIALERYVSFRFKTGLSPSRSAIEQYYRSEYRPTQQLLGTPVATLEEVSDSVRRILIERRANLLLEERVLELRALTRLELLLPPGQEDSP